MSTFILSAFEKSEIKREDYERHPQITLCKRWADEAWCLFFLKTPRARHVMGDIDIITLARPPPAYRPQTAPTRGQELIGIFSTLSMSIRNDFLTARILFSPESDIGIYAYNR